MHMHGNIERENKMKILKSLHVLFIYLGITSGILFCGMLLLLDESIFIKNSVSLKVFGVLFFMFFLSILNTIERYYQIKYKFIYATISIFISLLVIMIIFG